MFSEHRLIGLNARTERQESLDQAESGAVATPVKSPEQILKENTDRIAKEIQKRAGSIWTWMLGLRQRSLDKVIWEEANKRLQDEYEKLQSQNSLKLQKATRKQLLERVYQQVLKEQMEYLQEQRNTLVQRRKRLAAAASMLGVKIPPLPEPKYSDRTRNYLANLRAKDRGVGNERVQELQRLFQVERKLFEELVSAGVPAGEATSVIDDAVTHGSDDLRRKLVAIFGADRTDLVYEARLLRDSKGQHRLLEATRSNKPVFANEAQKMSYLAKEAKPGTKVNITTPSGQRIEGVLEHRSTVHNHHAIVRLPSVARSQPGAYAVIDTVAGVLTMRDTAGAAATTEFGLRGQPGDAALAIETPLSLAA